MRPFNLEQALSGAKLVTRDDWAVDRFVHQGENDEYPYSARIEDVGTEIFNSYGGYLIGRETVYDLFLADEPQPSPHIFITEIEKFLKEFSSYDYAVREHDLLKHFNQFIEDYPQFKTEK